MWLISSTNSLTLILLIKFENEHVKNSG
jgi:hypothetical protein